MGTIPTRRPANVMRRIIVSLAVLALLSPANEADARKRRAPRTGISGAVKGFEYKLGLRSANGATAKCRDGTLSFAANHRGACSHHGGVAQWYR